MAESGFKVEGLNQAVRALAEIGLEIDDLKDAFSEIAHEGAEKAAGFAPMRSGRLRASVRGNRAKGKALVSAGRASVPYAAPINYGWPRRGIKASGFMQKASDEMQPVAIEKLEQNINEKIREKGLA